MQRSVVCSLLAVALVGCSDPSGGPGEDGPEPGEYSAQIRWTSYGVPHITAEDMPSVAFGQGWAFAKLSGCILADQIVKVRGERARFHGAGEEDANVDSDFVHKFLDFSGKAEAAWEEQPENIQGLIQGYVAGYNAYLTEAKDALTAEEEGEEPEPDAPEPAMMPCAGEEWAQPITPQDLMAHYLELTTLASSRQLTDFIANAQPPLVHQEKKPTTRLDDALSQKPGSNGWGIGSERSASRGGLLFANPHFPWEGELKLYESHLTVPGELDVYGASLMGVVGVLIGFNEAVGWTHTVSAGHRFNFYVLDLDPADATKYMYDGESRDMEWEVVTIDVREANGDLKPRERQMYRTHYGPVVSIPELGYWNQDMTLAFRDANENNTKLINQFHDMNKAKSMDEFQAAHANNLGIPWVNTMSASADGRAWYMDSCPTPNLSPTAQETWANSEDFVVNALKGFGAVGLDGSTSANEWIEEPGALSPGLVPFAKMPQLERTDFIYNANDSHWLTNPMQPLTGYSPMHGPEGTARTPRTRMNATLLMEQGDKAAPGPDGLFDLSDITAAVLSNRGMVAELLRDAVVRRCEDFDSYAGVSLREACNAIDGWDLTLDLDSPGAVIWREFLGDYDFDAMKDGIALWNEPFDPMDPINTPRSLTEISDNPDDDRVLEALANAVTTLQTAGLTPSATLRQVQFTKRGATNIPIHGGSRYEGTTNLIIYSNLKTTLEPPTERAEPVNPNTGLTPEGYVVNYGTSFIMALQYTDGVPAAKAFLTYGQSNDPTSPHYTDQTQLFSDKQWRDILYTDAQIMADPNLSIEEIESK